MSGTLYEPTEESLARLAEAIRGGMDVMHSHEIADHRLPLTITAVKGNARGCEMLIKAGASPDRGVAWVNGPSPICEVIRAVNGETIFPGLGLGPSKLSISEAREVIRVLMAHGASIDGPAPTPGRVRALSCSPLHLAVDAGNAQAIGLLAELGADMEMLATVPSAGYSASPIGLARHLKNEDMMVVLLRHGAEERLLTATHNSLGPLAGAVAEGFEKVVEYYTRERGEDLAQRVEGRTLLQIARTPSMRQTLRALKTEFAVEKSLSVSQKPSRTAGPESIILLSEKCAQRRTFSPL